MKPRFVQAYLISAGAILALSALGKLTAVFPLVYYSCIEEPILGDYQFDLSNRELLGFAAVMEFVIVALIIFSSVKWLPCLASSFWGSLCLLVRMFFMKEDIHCHCLGWIEAPAVTVAVVAGWLAAGGGVAFWQAWRDFKQSKQT